MTTKIFDSRGRLVRRDQPYRDAGTTHHAVRGIYVLAVLSIFVPLRSSGWVGLAVGGFWLSPFGVVSLAAIALVVWRIVLVLRERARLDAPMQTGLLRWCRSLAIGLMAAGVTVYLLQLFVGPIGRALFPRGSDNGVEFFVVGVWLAMLTALAPLGLLLFESSRLLAFERWYREQRS